jgi:hypothetical protein
VRSSERVLSGERLFLAKPRFESIWSFYFGALSPQALRWMPKDLASQPSGFLV